MDVQVMDENGTRGAVLQHDELLEVLQYAVNWAGISNDSKRNAEVKDRIRDMRTVIDGWIMDGWRTK